MTEWVRVSTGDRTVEAVGPFYLMSMPGEVKDPTSPHWNVYSTSHSKPPRSASMRLKKLPCSDKGRRRRVRIRVGYGVRVVNRFGVKTSNLTLLLPLLCRAAFYCCIIAHCEVRPGRII